MRAPASNLARQGIVLLSRRGDAALPWLEDLRAPKRAVVVSDPYDAASQLLGRADVGVLVVDLSALTPRHHGLLRVARNRRVAILGYGATSGPVDAAQLDGVLMTARDRLAQRVGDILGAADDEVSPSTQASQDARLATFADAAGEAIPRRYPGDGGLAGEANALDDPEPRVGDAAPDLPEGHDLALTAMWPGPVERPRRVLPVGQARVARPAEGGEEASHLPARPVRRRNGQLAAILGEYRRVAVDASGPVSSAPGSDAPRRPPSGGAGSAEAAGGIREVLTEQELAALLEGRR
jgi:hypothetical protein